MIKRTVTHQPGFTLDTILRRAVATDTLRKVKKTYNLLFLFLSLLITMASCSKEASGILSIQAKAIDASLADSLLTGPSILHDPDRFVWGGSVIKGDDGKYHMLYSTWECGDTFPEFRNSWVLYSKIAYAVSDYPDKGFTFQKIVLQGRIYDGDSLAWDAQMVHNPHIKKFNDKYYLYYVGSKDPGIQAIGSPGEKVNKRNRVQQYQKIGLIEFDNFENLLSGNFIRSDEPILSARTRVKPDYIVNPSPKSTTVKPDNIIVVNPSVVQRPSDGKYLLYFKGNLYTPHWRGAHGVALADSPTGPFKALNQFVFDIKTDSGEIASTEDPFVWYHQSHKKFYAVVKDFSGTITKEKPGLALMESLDGIKWTVPKQPFFMKKELVLQSGDTVKVHRLERPQLLINKDGYPEVLYCATSVVDIIQRQDGISFNVQIPLKINK